VLSAEHQREITACLTFVQEELCCDMVLLLNPRHGTMIASVIAIDSTRAEQLLSLVVPYILMTHCRMKRNDGAFEPLFFRHEAAGYCYYFGYGAPDWAVVALSRTRLMVGLATVTVKQCVRCLGPLLT
jgi:hypothetical protein